MIFDVIMPKIGLTMEEGQIVKWRKLEGDWVDKGEGLLEVEAEKSNYDVEALYAGYIHILASEGKVYACNTVIGQIAETTEEYVSIKERIPPVSGIAEATSDGEETKSVGVTPAVEEARIRKRRGLSTISPAALRLAEKHKFDISQVKGTGAGGIVTREDVLREVKKREAPGVEKVAGRRESMSRLRKTIASRMTSSWQSTPHVLQMLECDVSKFMEFREKLNERSKKEFGFGLSMSHQLVKVTGAALEKNPIINARLDSEKSEIVYNAQINVGVAMNTPEGLMVPVIKAVNERSIFDIARSYRELAEKSARGALSIEDVSEGTFTISSLHELGIENGLAIINPPQSGVLFFGTCTKKPVVVDDQIVIRPMMWISFTFDHRIMDGLTAANFTSTVRGLIENPEQIAWE